jgi:hypothetical protein
MTYRLSVDSLTNAASHLCKYGDTDVFPRLVELLFLSEQKSAVIDELKELDLDQYSPGNAFEALAPKSRFGFRIAHQLPFVDTILLLAAVIEIGNLIEAHRPSAGGIEAFSYRFQTDTHGGIFRNDHTFKDWLAAQHNLLNANGTFTTIISTDISDFYSRINFHRLDNLLDEVAPKHGASRYIIKHIKAIRAKQSFGLPVGGAAAPLLAELALSDTDRALQQEGLSATRFVDDFRIFLGEQESPYDALALLARHLGLNEGLSLNVAKTRVQERNDYLLLLDNQITDVGSDAEGKALDALTSQLYTQEEPDPEELEKLKTMNLLGLLTNEIDQDSLDMGRIKVIFRALKLTKTTGTIDYLIQEFHKLVIFSKEVTLLMHELEKDNSVDKRESLNTV